MMLVNQSFAEVSTKTKNIDLALSNGYRFTTSPAPQNAAENITVGHLCSVVNDGNDLTGTWVNAFKYAINEINNNSGANIHITWNSNCRLLNNSYTVSVGVDPDHVFKSGIVAIAETANNGHIGRAVAINPWYSGFGIPTSSDFKRGVALHELLHTLGMQHSLSSQGYMTPGTDNPSDVLSMPTSAIHYKLSEQNPIIHLNEFDKKTLQYLFPL